MKLHILLPIKVRLTPGTLKSATLQGVITEPVNDKVALLTSNTATTCIVKNVVPMYRLCQISATIIL